LVDSWDALAASQGWVQRFKERAEIIVPRGGETEWIRGVENGVEIDPDAIPKLWAGIKAGRPPPDFMMTPKPSEATDLKIVLSLGLSPSTEGRQRYKMLQTAMLIGDGFKAFDPNIQISVMGHGSRPVLISSFADDWKRAKAHMLHRANVMATRGDHKASDDERGVVEAMSMLKLLGAKNGMIFNIDDGMGMGGTSTYSLEVNAAGFTIVHIGPGAFCTGVVHNFGPEYGLSIVNVDELPMALPPLVKAQQEQHGLG
jgi:hypothetical protein